MDLIYYFCVFPQRRTRRRGWTPPPTTGTLTKGSLELANTEVKIGLYLGVLNNLCTVLSVMRLCCVYCITSVLLVHGTKKVRNLPWPKLILEKFFSLCM